MTRPNLFIVGAPRSGTTSMFNYLKAHPEIAMGARKEPHFFSDDLIDPDFVRDEADYLAIFRERGDRPFVGEGSVWYLYSHRAAKRIHEFNPDARIIALLRNPVDMLPSIHTHHVYTGYQAVEDFVTAYHSHGMVRERCGSFRSHLDYSKVARYGDQLERFFGRFSREAIHVSLYDDLKSDASQVYGSIIDFVGLRPGHELAFKRLNRQRRIRSEAVARLHRRMTSRMAASPSPSTRPGAVLRKGVAVVNRLIGRLNAAEITSRPLTPRMRREIIADYRHDILKLSDLIGRDLSHWLE